MRDRTLPAAVVAFVAALAMATPAAADCIDHLQCICPAVANVAAAGVIENVRTETDDSGFEVEIGELRIERLSLRDEDDTRFVEGQLVDVSLPSDAGPSSRVLAFAHPGDASLAVLGRIDGGNVFCSGEPFSEDEALEMVVSPTCRDTAGERIEAPPCNDTVSFGDCTMGRAPDPSFAWWLLALVPWLRRRRAQS